MRPTRQQRSRRSNRQRGTALVELALVLPLLLLLSLMVMEGGEMIRTHIVLNNAAREGARFSTLQENQGNIAGIQQVVTDYAALNGVTIPASEITVVQTDTIPGPGGTLMWGSQVTVQHPYTMNYVPRLPGAKVGTTTLLYGRAEFRNFYGF
jgi:Flp pilus assembly protein TadG